MGFQAAITAFAHRVGALEVTERSATIQVYRHDTVAQRYAKQTITFTANGMRMLPVALRYCWLSELDLMATQAGLELQERYADWERRPFDSDSTSHISVYQPATGASRRIPTGDG